MKNIQIAALALFILTASPFILKGQTNKNNPYTYAYTDKKGFTITEQSQIIYINEINTNAVTDFAKRYKDITVAKWYLTENGFAAYFTIDSIKTCVYYDQKGNYQNRLRCYYENRLPRNIRHIVRSNFYDFTIYYIKEVDANDITAYVVTLEDNSCWKTIKIIDGELEEVETIKKS